MTDESVQLKYKSKSVFSSTSVNGMNTIASCHNFTNAKAHAI